MVANASPCLVGLRRPAPWVVLVVAAAAAARLGSVQMAAYSLTFNLGFATSQLCESVSIASQALLARDVPFDEATVCWPVIPAFVAGFDSVLLSASGGVAY